MKSEISWRNKVPEICIVLVKIITNKNYYSIRYNSENIPVIRRGKGLNLLSSSISNLYVCEAGILSAESLIRQANNATTVTSCNWVGLVGTAEHKEHPEKVYKASIHYLLNSYKQNAGKDFLWFEDNRTSPYNHAPGWKSAHTQIAFIQLLFRAFKYEQKEEYISLLNKALNAFYVPVEEGGLTNKISENSWWYMKFAEPSSKNLRVLNSMLFILIGLYELNEIDQLIDGKQKKLIENGEQALQEHLSIFDSGSWSYYDNNGTSSGSHYHQKHIQLLERMHELTGNVIYQKYASLFQNYKEQNQEF